MKTKNIVSNRRARKCLPLDSCSRMSARPLAPCLKILMSFKIMPKSTFAILVRTTYALLFLPACSQHKVELKNAEASETNCIRIVNGRLYDWGPLFREQEQLLAEQEKEIKWAEAKALRLRTGGHTDPQTFEADKLRMSDNQKRWREKSRAMRKFAISGRILDVNNDGIIVLGIEDSGMTAYVGETVLVSHHPSPDLVRVGQTIRDIPGLAVGEYKYIHDGTTNMIRHFAELELPTKPFTAADVRPLPQW